MGAVFEKAYAFTAVNEGGYVDNLKDSGGQTAFGVSRRYWPKWPGWVYVDQVEQINKPTAWSAISIMLRSIPEFMALVSAFYKANYWNARYEELTSQAIASKIFDESVNLDAGDSGPERAVRFLQFAVTSCGISLMPDGWFGPSTLAAVNTMCLQPDDEAKLLAAYVHQLRDFYLNDVAENPKNQCFLQDWLTRSGRIPPE